MKVNLSREAMVLLVLFGIIMIANPNMWWLMFVIGPMIMNGMRDRGDRGNEGRTQEEERRERARSSRPRTRIGEEMRRQRESSSRSRPRQDDGYENPTTAPRPAAARPRPAPAVAKRGVEPLSHAVEAVEIAGHAPEDLALLPVDIGFIAYRGSEKPVVHREAPIPDTVDFIQPYVELYLERAAAGTLRFEVVDGAGEVHYVREERRQLKAGRTPVIPATRMPVGDFLYTDTNWSLRVYAANTLIAEHPFGWVDPEAGMALREHLSEDGELSADLELLVEEARLQPMSLDELLSEENVPPAVPQTQQQARRGG